MKRKLLSVLLATAMTVSLVACGNSNSEVGQQEKESAETKQTSTQKSEETEETVEVSEIDIMAPYEEPVTISIGQIAWSWDYEGNDSDYDNVWTREYKNRFNIDLDVVFAETTEYGSKVNLAIAEQNIPDVMRVTYDQLQQLIDADMLCDLTDVFETYAYDSIKSYMEMDPVSFENGKRDGKLYGIPRLGDGAFTELNYVWIRKAWKEALKLEDPETMEDVLDICRAFMQEYGGYGMGVVNNLASLNILAQAWGAHPGIWVETESGEIGYGSVQPEMKTALAEFAKWYQEGIIDENFATMDTVKVNEDQLNGKYGVYAYGQAWGWAPGNDMVDLNGPEAIFEPYAIPSATGEEVLHGVNSTNTHFIVVSKECENPEAVIKMINLKDDVKHNAEFAVAEPEVRSALNDDAREHMASVLGVEYPNKEKELVLPVLEAVEKRDINLLSAELQSRYNEHIDFIENGSRAGVGRYLQSKAFVIAKEIWENDQVLQNMIWGVKTESIIENKSILDSFLVEGFSKIIMGMEPIDYFDTIVEEWKASGGDQMTTEVNEFLSK